MARTPLESVTETNIMQRSLSRARNWRNIIDPLVLFVLFGLAWEKSVSIFHIKAYLLPPLSKVFESLWENRGNLLLQSWITTQEVLAGFILAVIGGIVLGLIIHASAILRRTLYPLIVVFQGLPKIALASLMVQIGRAN